MFVFTFDYKPIIAVIGDIVASKRLKDRRNVQEKLIAVLNDINQTYGSDISSRFMITLGDEFQGLLHSGACVTEIIEKIEWEMYPVRLRFGIGVGEITTEIDSNLPLGADGPAYYNAREMIDTLKANEKKKMKPKSNIGIKIDCYGHVSELINTIFSLNTIIKAKWTNRQREIINVYVRRDEETQNSVAQKLGIDQSSVYKALAGSGFYNYQQALQSVTNVLSQIREKQDV